MARKFADGFALVVSGAGVGWILGQSSGATQSAVTAIIGIAAAIVTTLAGVHGDVPADDEQKRTQRWRLKLVTPLPLALFLVGLCAASAASLRTRTHELLGITVADEVARWAALGIPKDEVSRRLFELRVPTNVPGVVAVGKTPKDLVDAWIAAGVPKERVSEALFSAILGDRRAVAEKPPAAHTNAVLMGVPISECNEVRAGGYSVERMKASHSAPIKAAAAITDSGTRKEVIDAVCTTPAVATGAGSY